jgi:hypothetical protein
VKDGLAQRRSTHAPAAASAAPAKGAKSGKAASATTEVEVAAAVFEVTTLLNRGDATRALSLLHEAVARHGERPELLALRQRIADALLDGLDAAPGS